ncbi:hypothetical protein GGR52DRAFT_589593 [Hypoxylon sp. FL1284]|nr:hypothetical protein GGR52DRAFT_589593 [Hypoxylon sp. FL1284]
MKVETSAALLVLLGVASARPDAVKISRKPRHAVGASAKFRREVPQEHSHEKFLTGVGKALDLNNVDQVQDPVFALLGNAAAADGAGLVDDLDCLQQRVADQAFTNAKAANDVDGMANALIFRAIERNTASVGLASVQCTETAKNPEIAALQQHQDPASDGAAALNKQITLDLAVQLASVGADPQLALQSGTFEPGDVNDNTGAGNTCDEENDAEGCIFSQNLLVEDATPDEIDGAVAAGGSANTGSANGNANGNANSGAAAGNSTATPPPTPAAGANPAADANAGAADGANVNAFTGSVGSAPVPVISSAANAKPFSVNGAEFLNQGAAIQRACDVQKNACANAANSGSADISVSDCDAQQQQCVAQSDPQQADAQQPQPAAADPAQQQAAGPAQQQSATPAAGKQRGDAAGAAAFGDCGSPAISFGKQADRPNEDAFGPVNTADFNHGSALKPAVITDFICSQLASKCKADDAAVAECQQGADAADALDGQEAADAFNAALGV